MNYKIDKSLFTDAERAQYEALIAKAAVATDEEYGDEEEWEEERLPRRKKRPPEFDDEYEEDTEKSNCKKSVSPELAAALERMEALEKSVAMKDFTEVAKKYAPLGEKEDELAQRLYDMKKSNEENYNAYISILDKSLGLVNKSGLFSEIGKSAHGTSGTAADKIGVAAGEIMKSDPTISREQAIAKAWENHPEILSEYEAEYNAR